MKKKIVSALLYVVLFGATMGVVGDLNVLDRFGEHCMRYEIVRPFDLDKQRN